MLLRTTAGTSTSLTSTPDQDNLQADGFVALPRPGSSQLPHKKKCRYEALNKT